MTYPDQLQSLTQQATDFGFCKGFIVGVGFGLGVLAFLLIMVP